MTNGGNNPYANYTNPYSTNVNNPYANYTNPYYVADNTNSYANTNFSNSNYERGATNFYNTNSSYANTNWSNVHTNHHWWKWW